MAWRLQEETLRLVRPFLRTLVLDYVERGEAKIEFQAA